MLHYARRTQRHSTRWRPVNGHAAHRRWYRAPARAVATSWHSGVLSSGSSPALRLEPIDRKSKGYGASKSPASEQPRSRGRDTPGSIGERKGPCATILPIRRGLAPCCYFCTITLFRGDASSKKRLFTEHFPSMFPGRSVRLWAQTE